MPDRTSELDRWAERFDGIYTQLTGLQRELVSAVRNGASDADARALIERARIFVQAADAAAQTMGLAAREVEERAMAARVLAEPIEAFMLAAAMRSLGRAGGYRLLAEAVTAAAASDGLQRATKDRSLGEWLAAPNAVGAATATRLSRHLELDPDGAISQLGADQLQRLVTGLLDVAANGLPPGLDHRRRREAAQLDGSGLGAARAVLSRWVEVLGLTTELGSAARSTFDEPGWSSDAVPVAERIVALTATRIAANALPGFPVIAGLADADERLAAMRSESSAWRRGNLTAEGEISHWVMAACYDRLVDAVKAARNARRLLAIGETEWTNQTPLSEARRAVARAADLALLLDFGESSVEALKSFGNLDPDVAAW